MQEKATYSQISVTEIPGLSAVLHLYRHLKTGAELAWLERESDNKTFCISFQTLPEDSTGVFHILEHSVLCGSEKYPVKEPFVELLKGSLNTFLNAMTFPDKTIYPVSSRNDADFRNLMHIYLDAVFCPNLCRNANIFRQEGWHYELDENGQPYYVGVVYGEMKGAFSTVDELIYTRLNAMLFPDSPYRFCAGGDPKHIPELGYEQFVESYHRFYHPSNAKIFLDGKLCIEEILADLDEAYLCRFDRKEPDHSLKMQHPVSFTQDTISYEISPDEDTNGMAIFTMGKVIGSWKDRERILAMQVLADCLVGSNSAPLRSAILRKGLGRDVGIAIDDSIAQPYLMMQIRGCDAGLLPEMKEAVQQILCRIASEGLDVRELAASLNKLEFQHRELPEPSGVHLAIRADRSWMYGGDPEAWLDLSDVFADLRKKLESGYFTELLNEVFLRDEGMAVLFALPSHTLGQEIAEAEAIRLSEIADAWTEKDREEIAHMQQELVRWQQAGDPADTLASIPHLDLTDLPAEPFWTDCETTALGKVRVLRPKAAVVGTSYIHLYFDLPPMPLEKLPEMTLLTALLGNLPTKFHDRQELARLIKTYVGKLEFSVAVHGGVEDPDHAVCSLHIAGSVLADNAAYAVSLIREILLHTELDHTEMVMETVRQKYMMVQQSLIMNGHQYAFTHALAGLTAENAAMEMTSGYGQYRFLRSAAECFDGDAIRRPMQAILDQLPQLPLTVGIAGTVDDALVCTLTEGFGGDPSAPTVTLPEAKRTHDAISIPASVAYAVQGGNLMRLGAAYHGSFALAAKILSLNYLWNEVRVQGGAYGAGMAVIPNGNLFSYSYRDPDPSRTLGIYRKAAAYLRSFCEAQEEYRQLIIGTVSDSEPLQSPEDECITAIERVLNGMTRQQAKLKRKQLLEATYDDLLYFCDLLEKIAEQESVCVIGSSALLDSCAEDTLKRLS